MQRSMVALLSSGVQLADVHIIYSECAVMRDGEWKKQQGKRLCPVGWLQTFAAFSDQPLQYIHVIRSKRKIFCQGYGYHREIDDDVAIPADPHFRLDCRQAAGSSFISHRAVISAMVR